MRDIMENLPARRAMPSATVTARRHAIERATRVRRRLTNRKPWLLAPVGAVAAGALAVVLVTDALTPTAAYATWTAEPGTLSSAETSALGERCVASVRATFPEAAADLKPVLGERRGTFQTALIAGGRQLALCADWLGVEDGAGLRGSSLSGLTLDEELKPGEVLQVVAVPGQLSGAEAARIAFGLVSSDVRAVKVTTADDIEVTASVQDGYFLAWWPSGADAARVEAIGAGGRILAEIGNP